MKLLGPFPGSLSYINLNFPSLCLFLIRPQQGHVRGMVEQSGADLRGRRILLVDDEKLIGELIERLVNARGARTSSE